MLPAVSLPMEAPGGTNSACQWLLAHGGLKSSRRQGCGFTKHRPIPLLQAVPKVDVLACQLFLWAFLLEQWHELLAHIPGSAASWLEGQEGPDPEIGSGGHSMVLITPRLWVQSLYRIFAWQWDSRILVSPFQPRIFCESVNPGPPFLPFFGPHHIPAAASTGERDGLCSSAGKKGSEKKLDLERMGRNRWRGAGGDVRGFADDHLQGENRL